MRAANHLNSIVPHKSLIAVPFAGATTDPKPLGREIELKFLVNDDAFKTIRQATLLGYDAGRGAACRLHSTYFDTERGDLRRHRIVLRMRRQDSRHVLTLKWEGRAGSSTFERGELEAPAPSSLPDPALLGAAVEAEIMRVTEGRPLQPVFATDIKRVVHRVAVGVSKIEAAFDTGFIVCGVQKTPVREIELELKAGEPTDLYQLGLSLAANFPVRLGIITKAERGVLLSCGAHATAVRAAAPKLAERTVDEAIDAVMSACVAQFTANWPAFEGPDKVESVHQMRVAMRRFRAALTLFNRRFPCVEFRALRAEAKQIASAMGDARNWDVFESLVNAGPRSAFPSESGFDALMADATQRREGGHAAVAKLLAQPETTRFVLSAEAFVARRGWRNTLPGAELSRLVEPASGFAAECLERLHRRVCKRGKALLDLPPERRHDVRIALKNLRYAADFFADLFSQAAVVKSYVQAAARLQDALGGFNDMVMAADLVSQLDTASAGPARAAGIIIGWHGRGAQGDDHSLRDCWRGFRKAKPFWTQALTDPVAGAAM
ncbi:MAG TPA: CHAD domain-containing protein [Rhodopila sp.]|jgi:inorganic triphosphatase YgiF